MRRNILEHEFNMGQPEPGVHRMLPPNRALVDSRGSFDPIFGFRNQVISYSKHFESTKLGISGHNGLIVTFFRRTLQASQNAFIPLNVFNGLKIILEAMLVGVSVARLCVIISADEEKPDVEYVTASYFVVIYASSLVLHLLCMRRGVVTSALQFAFYLASVTCGGFTVRHLSIR